MLLACTGVFVLGWSLGHSSGTGDAAHVHLLGTLMRQGTQQRFSMECTPLPVEPGLTSPGPRLTTPGNKTFNPGGARPLHDALLASGHGCMTRRCATDEPGSVLNSFEC